VSIKHIQKEKKLYALTGPRTDVIIFRRVLPSRVDALGYLRLGCGKQAPIGSIHPWKQC